MLGVSQGTLAASGSWHSENVRCEGWMASVCPFSKMSGAPPHCDWFLGACVVCKTCVCKLWVLCRVTGA